MLANRLAFAEPDMTLHLDGGTVHTKPGKEAGGSARQRVEQKARIPSPDPHCRLPIPAFAGSVSGQLAKRRVAEFACKLPPANPDESPRTCHTLNPLVVALPS